MLMTYVSYEQPQQNKQRDNSAKVTEQNVCTSDEIGDDERHSIEFR